MKHVIPESDIIRHFKCVACCLHVSEDDCLPSKPMAREVLVVPKEKIVVMLRLDI